MGVLSVRHLTTYHYAEPVQLGEHRMMFRPRESHDLRLIRARLNITPQPADLHWLHDVFDNSVAVANFDCATTWLQFDSMITLQHVETRLPDYALEFAARTFPFDYPRDERPDLAQALHRADPSLEVDQWAARFLPSRVLTSRGLPQARSRTDTIGTMDLLRAMALGIRQQLRYLRRVERGVQTPVETLRVGSGTCRDFAWLMIDAVRALGLAARFVSGYIYVPDAPLKSIAAPASPLPISPQPISSSASRSMTSPVALLSVAAVRAPLSATAPLPIDDGGATHAWLQVYLPGAGWVDFDPTNSIIGNRNLIRVAVAWSPMQVLPLWGTYIGSASSCLGMQVMVSVTEEPDHSNTLA
jgi:transglutaminase-like putative cysteine protease